MGRMEESSLLVWSSTEHSAWPLFQIFCHCQLYIMWLCGLLAMQGLMWVWVSEWVDIIESLPVLTQLPISLWISEPQEKSCFLTHFSLFPILAHDYIRLPTSLKGRALPRRPAINWDPLLVQAGSRTWHCEYSIRNQQADLARPWALGTQNSWRPWPLQNTHHSQA